MARILLLLPNTTYRATDFLEAARRMGVEVTVGSQGPNVMEAQNPAGYLDLTYDDLEWSTNQVVAFARTDPIQAVLGMDDQTTVLAAHLARALSLSGNSVEAAEASRNKFLMREQLHSARLPIPDYRRLPVHERPEHVAQTVQYPCVLKPLMLAASQGVIRANDPREFIQAWKRLVHIIEKEKTVPEMLVESFIPGREVALEGLLERGSLRVLALFDKPDPLEGPFFEETIYVRPSRLPQPLQDQVVRCAAQATRALGLERGPIHAELRINEGGPWIIEVAARPIGGRCSRALRFEMGLSLEELIIRQALGLETQSLHPDPTPSGVMMIPIPQAGVLREVMGVEEAQQVTGIEDLLISAHVGQVLVPLPEGSSYLGFIFARAGTPEQVEQALRTAHHKLCFVIGADIMPRTHLNSGRQNDVVCDH